MQSQNHFSKDRLKTKWNNFIEKMPTNLLQKDRLLILLLSGILLLVITIPVNPKQERDLHREKGNDYYNEEKAYVSTANLSSENKSIETYTQYLETQLEEILSLIQGAGNIRVMITLEDGGERVVEKDTESVSETVEEADSAGGERTSVNSSVKEVSIYNNESSDTEGSPYITKEKSPVVAGVVVIAQGGDNAVVVRNITEAVQALFDMETHKIKVIKGN